MVRAKKTLCTDYLQYIFTKNLTPDNNSIEQRFMDFFSLFKKKCRLSAEMGGGAEMHFFVKM